MNKKLKYFILGFTHAFTPYNYSQCREVGDTTDRINKKISKSREVIHGKIKEITTQSNSTVTSLYSSRY